LTTRRHHRKILSSGNNLKQLSIAPPDAAGQRNVKGHSGREEEDKGRQAPNGRAKEFSSNPCQYLEYIFSSVISGIIHPNIQEIEEIGGKTFGRLQRARSSIQYTDQRQDIVKMSQTRISTTTLQASVFLRRLTMIRVQKSNREASSCIHAFRGRGTKEANYVNGSCT